MAKKAEASTAVVSVESLEEGLASRTRDVMARVSSPSAKTGRVDKKSRNVVSGLREIRETLGGARSVVAIRSDDPLITQAVVDIVNRVTEIVASRREAISQQNIDALVDAYLKSEPMAPVRHSLELDNARERARFVEEHDCLSSKDVARLAGHGAANASATATRWKKAGRIFSLPWKDGDLYPAFEFADGQPRPLFRRLLAILGGKRTPWQIAFWLTSTNSWLDGAAPLERLDDENAVVAAAENETGVVFG
ncbi:MAG: hypothetical protein HYV07_20880 [Deltaproteobacteria bacterium]|nr:hypothetical protein [Deltaproteobacteria bacterium]